MVETGAESKRKRRRGNRYDVRLSGGAARAKLLATLETDPSRDEGFFICVAGAARRVPRRLFLSHSSQPFFVRFASDFERVPGCFWCAAVRRRTDAICCCRRSRHNPRPMRQGFSRRCERWAVAVTIEATELLSAVRGARLCASASQLTAVRRTPAIVTRQLSL